MKYYHRIISGSNAAILAADLDDASENGWEVVSLTCDDVKYYALVRQSREESVSE